MLYRRLHRAGLACSLRIWFLFKKWKRHLASIVLNRAAKIKLGNNKIARLRRLMRGIKNVQGMMRGMRGRKKASRHRVIREAVRFVVRTAILFGAARASAELMEPHFAAQMIQRGWRKSLRRRKIKAMRLKRQKLGLRHGVHGTKHGNNGSHNDHNKEPEEPDRKRIVGKWIQKQGSSGRNITKIGADMSPVSKKKALAAAKKRKKKDDGLGANGLPHAYFRRGKRDSIVAFTKAAAMISKIHLLNGGEWGIRDDESASFAGLVSPTVNKKMKEFAMSAANRIKKAKDDEVEEKKRKEEFIKGEKKRQATVRVAGEEPHEGTHTPQRLLLAAEALTIAPPC